MLYERLNRSSKKFTGQSGAVEDRVPAKKGKEIRIWDENSIEYLSALENMGNYKKCLCCIIMSV